MLKQIIIIILLIIVIVIVILKEFKNKKNRNLIIFSFIIRIILIIVDNFIFNIPFSGADSLVFEKYGWEMSEGNYNSTQSYVIVISLVYQLIGRSKILISLINVSFYMITGIILNKIIKKLNIKNKIRNKLLLLFYFFPISFFLTSVILREGLIIFFLTYSIYNFILYIKFHKIRLIIYSMFLLILASWLHGGIIFMGVGYLSYFWNKKSKNKIKKMILPVLLMIGIYIIIKNGLISKLDGDIGDKMINSTKWILKNKERIGSNYFFLNNVSLKTIIAYFPINYFYFLFSPTPNLIRNLTDLIIFLVDSLIYIYIIFRICMLLRLNLKKISTLKKIVLKSLLISWIAISSIFALGTFNYGTAIRHRFKLLIILLIIYAIIDNSKKAKYKVGKK